MNKNDDDYGILAILAFSRISVGHFNFQLWTIRVLVYERTWNNTLILFQSCFFVCGIFFATLSLHFFFPKTQYSLKYLRRKWFGQIIPVLNRIKLGKKKDKKRYRIIFNNTLSILWNNRLVRSTHVNSLKKKKFN